MLIRIMPVWIADKNISGGSTSFKAAVVSLPSFAPLLKT